MPNAEVDEAEIAKLVSDGGLKPETLARRKTVRAAFQQKLLCKNVTVSMYPKNSHCWIDCIVQNKYTTM